MVSCRQQNCIVLHHEQFKDGKTFVDVHAAQDWVQVQSKGPRDHFLNNPQALDSNEGAPCSRYKSKYDFWMRLSK